MNDFPYLIFRKCCYFCANEKTCKENNGNLSDFDLCSDFVLREDLARFLSTEIFDAVLEVVEKRKKGEVVVHG